MQKLKDFIETFSVGIILLFVLLPIRILFVRYVADDWLGSFGLITAFSLLILYLSKKNKLGWFGRAYTRQMFKVHKGKRRIFVYSQLAIGFIFFTGTIYAIQLGDSFYVEEKTLVIEGLDVKNMDELIKQSQDDIRLRDLPLAIMVFFYMVLFRFDLFAIMLASLNEISNGWVMHFATVFLVEDVELIGILILTKFTIKKPIE